ncbi:glucosaminidase domain-containing protein [Shewanella subflava]|uniref:Glucosaminidase domain-containing protein n=1 Tax=Shewanella subflava TaxID=2986476 RepID=A0ABT3IBU2_9GAMM|nr:glucosaminidase domain-containing protein [Shewanella subflava]MCW3173348.1 glucosaminidase domain-containing protein [Shewanella subflava]
MKIMTKSFWALLGIGILSVSAFMIFSLSTDKDESLDITLADVKNTTDAKTDIKLAPLSAFTDNEPDQLQNSFSLISDNRPTQKPKRVPIYSLDSIKNLFDSLNYNSQSWQQGNREVPRLTFNTVTEKWQRTANSIPVEEKKMIFFRLMAPLILLSNEKMLLERRYIEVNANSDEKVRKLALKYNVIDEEFLESGASLSDEQRTTLLNSVDIVPPSLVLAQAAEESGWATSRFTIEGNAFFGQWDFSGNGMVPKQQRTELGNYGIARFDSPLASVIGYLHNINTNNAYQKLRDLRAKLRHENAPITGLALASTLDKYSERGQAYIDSLRNMIRFNGLDQVDEAYLSDAHPLHLITGSQ